MAGKCTAPLKKFAPNAKADWNGWGVDPTNSRFQPNPGLAAADVPRLKLKWAFGYPKETLASAQPTVVGGRVFVGSYRGNVYSLDASSGCTIWSFNAGAGVRTAITVAAAKTPGKYIVFFGDLHASAHALDAETGQELWKTKVEDHPAATLTGAPMFYNGTLYVPVSSIEEASAASSTYECCTFRGSLVALDAETGKQLWKSYTVADSAEAFQEKLGGHAAVRARGRRGVVRAHHRREAQVDLRGHRRLVHRTWTSTPATRSLPILSTPESFSGSAKRKRRTTSSWVARDRPIARKTMDRTTISAPR